MSAGALPAKFAYVIQFGSEAADPSLPISGRIEHVVSGRQRRFCDAAEMLKVLEEMLDASRSADV
jgi:hypothetical protein